MYSELFSLPESTMVNHTKFTVNSFPSNISELVAKLVAKHQSCTQIIYKKKCFGSVVKDVCHAILCHVFVNDSVSSFNPHYGQLRIQFIIIKFKLLK